MFLLYLLDSRLFISIEKIFCNSLLFVSIGHLLKTGEFESVILFTLSAIFGHFASHTFLILRHLLPTIKLILCAISDLR